MLGPDWFVVSVDSFSILKYTNVILIFCFQLFFFCWHQFSALVRHGKMGGAGRVNRVCWSKRVIFKWVNWVAGQSGHGLSQVELTRIFQTIFFFFEINAIYQLFMSSLTMIRFSLMILLPITTKHLTWYPNLVQLLFQLSRS